MVLVPGRNVPAAPVFDASRMEPWVRRSSVTSSRSTSAPVHAVEDLSFDGRTRARSSDSSGRTAPARPRRSGCSLDLIRPTRGQRRGARHEPRRVARQLRRRIGYVPGDLALYDRLTGRQQLESSPHCAGCVTRRGRASSPNDCRSRSTVRSGRLSRGNRQKLGVVQAFFHEPELLMLDEPTSGLDPVAQREFRSLVREATARGAAVLLSSHVLSEVQRVADRVAIVRQGRLLTIEPMREIEAKALRVRRDPLRRSRSAPCLREPPRHPRHRRRRGPAAGIGRRPGRRLDQGRVALHGREHLGARGRARRRLSRVLRPRQRCGCVASSQDDVRPASRSAVVERRHRAADRRGALGLAVGARRVPALVQNYPKALLAFFGIDRAGVGSAAGYLQAELFGFMVPLMLIAYMIAARLGRDRGRARGRNARVAARAAGVSHARAGREVHRAAARRSRLITRDSRLSSSCATTAFDLHVAVSGLVAATLSAYVLAHALRRGRVVGRVPHRASSARGGRRVGQRASPRIS